MAYLCFVKPTERITIEMNSRLFSFVGGVSGAWRIVNVSTVTGDSLAEVSRLDVVTGSVAEMPDGAKWVLRGLTSNERYVTRSEQPTGP